MLKNINKRRAIFKQIDSSVKVFTRELFQLSTLKVFLIVLGISMTYLFKIIIDNVIIERNSTLFMGVIIAYLALYVLESLVLFFQRKISNNYYNNILGKSRAKIFFNYLKLPFNRIGRYQKGDVKSRLDSDCEKLETFISNQLIDYGYYVLLAIIYCFTLIAISYHLATFGILMVPLSFLINKWLTQSIKKHAEFYRATYGDYENWLRKSISSWKDTKVFGLLDRQMATFENYWDKLNNTFFTTHLYACGNMTFISIKDFFITKMNLYFVGGILIFNNMLTIGELLVFMKFFEIFYECIIKIIDADVSINQEIPSINRVIEMLHDNALEEHSLSSSRAFNHEKIPNTAVNSFSSLELCNIDFRYDQEEAFHIKDLSLTISKNDVIQLVGKSGSGKSTVIKLIAGLEVPTKGSIDFYSGSNEIIPIKNIRQKVGVVLQESKFLNTTIYENMMLGNNEATMEDIVNSCKAADIHEFIEKLPDGYRTVIGEDGMKLSGGQRHRLALARTLICKPEVLILDEPTSNLDGHTESNFINAIQKLSNEMTVIMITHRLSTIQNGNRVVLIENGRVLEDGKLEHLLEYESEFKRFFTKQIS
ncbi:ABC transporter ATP-binding protein [Fusibacter sp. JL298sf-3]